MKATIKPVAVRADSDASSIAAAVGSLHLRDERDGHDVTPQTTGKWAPENCRAIVSSRGGPPIRRISPRATNRRDRRGCVGRCFAPATPMDAESGDGYTGQ